MSAQVTISEYYTREKIVMVQNVFPWASTMLCKSVLLEFKGAVNEACCLLAETNGGLSDTEADIPKAQYGAIQISESPMSPSYQLSQDPAPGLEGFLLQHKPIAHSSPPRLNEMIEISLIGNAMPVNLRETGPGVFEVPADTRFSLFDKNAVKTCFVGSSISNNVHRVENEELKRPQQLGDKPSRIWNVGVGPGNDNQLQDSSDSSGTIHGVGETPAERSITSGTSLGITTSNLRECSHVNHHTAGVYSLGVEIKNNIFHREEHSPREKQRMAFTAAAVIRAACKRKKARIQPEFKVFNMCRGPFTFPWKVPVDVGEYMYVGTNRGRFAPRPWTDPEDSKQKGYLQSISVLGQYKRYSLEELRFGDYLRGRTRAPHLFSLFRKLPAELRIQVWRFAREPRVVELRFNMPVTHCWTPCALPTLFRVCRESRIETLKSCQLAFGLDNWTPRIYFDFDIDTLFLTFEKNEDQESNGMLFVEGLLKKLLQHDNRILHKVRELAIDAGLWFFWKGVMDEELVEWMDLDDEELPRPEMSVLPLFAHLRELKMVQNYWIGFWRQESRFYGHDENSFVDDDDAEFLPILQSEFEEIVGEAFCDCPLRRIQFDDPEWLMPVLSFLEKF